MSAVSQAMLLAAKSVTPVAVVTKSSLADSGDLTTYNFAAMGLSTTGHNVAIFVGQGGSAVASSCTIDGAAGTKVVEATATNRNISMWIAAATGASSGIASITFGGAQSRAGCQTFGMTNAGSATATATGTANSGDPIVISLNIPANGSAISGTYSDGNVNFTWTNLTEFADLSIEGGNISMSSAYGNFSSVQTGLSIQADLDTAPGNQLMVAAAWGP